MKNGVANYAARNRHIIADWTQKEAYDTLRDQDIVLPDWRIAGDFGTAVHQVVENIINEIPLEYNLNHVESTKTYPVSNTFTEFVPKYWGEFVRVHNIKPLYTEKTVINKFWGYQGRFDTIMEVDGEIAIVDTKSNKNGPKHDVALQNKAYGEAPFMIDMETGAKVPMPKITKSYVLWIREEGWNLFPLQYDDEVFCAFLSHVDLFNRCAWQLSSFLGEPIHAEGIQPVKSFRR